MHINVRDILAESVGYSRSYKIEGEQPQFELVRLTKPIDGELKVTRLDSNIQIKGRIQTEIELVCDRCLRTFASPQSVRINQLYAQKPGDDELKIDGRGDLDLDPAIEQQLALEIPIKILHDPDCPGIEAKDIAQPKNH